MQKEIHCKLQKTCYTLQSRAATCNLFKTNSTQSLAKAEPSSTLCNCCKPKKVPRQIAKRACYMLQPTCNFSRNAIETQVAKKIASCNTSYRPRFYCLQRLQRFFKSIASCSPRWLRVTCLLQLQAASKITLCNTTLKL